MTLIRRLIADFDHLNGSCLETSSDDEHVSSYGRCNATDNAADLEFVADYCPSHTAWLIVLGLCSYLFFFAPGMG